MRTNAKIYVFEGKDGTLKLGHARRPEARAMQVGAVSILHVTEIKQQAEVIERTAHRLLKLSGKHVRGEWFRMTLEEAIEAIERAERIANGEELPLLRTPPKTRQINVRIDEETEAQIIVIRKYLAQIDPNGCSISDAIKHCIRYAYQQLIEK